MVTANKEEKARLSTELEEAKSRLTSGANGAANGPGISQDAQAELAALRSESAQKDAQIEDMKTKLGRAKEMVMADKEEKARLEGLVEDMGAKLGRAKEMVLAGNEEKARLITELDEANKRAAEHLKKALAEGHQGHTEQVNR